MSSVPPPSPSPSPKSRVIVTKTGWKRTVLAVLAGVLVLGGVTWGIFATKQRQAAPSPNKVTGIIVEKINKHETETEISVGRKGLKSKETDSGYAFMVRNPDNGKDYEIETNEAEFEAKNIGELKEFILPPSEQK